MDDFYHHPFEDSEDTDPFEDFINGLDLSDLPDLPEPGEPTPLLTPEVNPITSERVEANLRAYVRRAVERVTRRGKDDIEWRLTLVQQLIREELFMVMEPSEKALEIMSKKEVLANAGYLFMALGWVIYAELENGFDDPANNPLPWDED